MNRNRDRERLLAHYYDLEYEGYADDVQFYVQYARAMDPEKALPVLELGCGTGRIALALAKEGFQVVGVDRSEGMIELLGEKAERLGLGGRVEIIRAGMADLATLSDGSFNLAFCALNTFSYAESTTEQLAALHGVARKLVQHGILIVDLTPPMPGYFPPEGGEIVHQGSFRDADGSGVHKFVSGVASPSTQSHDVTIFYDREGPDGRLHRLSERQRFRWVGRYEMELLLRVAGFDLEKIYGSYDLDEYTDGSERMIFVART